MHGERRPVTARVHCRPFPTMEPVDIQRDSLLRTRQAAQERAAPLARAVL
eukprot:COSAG01_NODE_49479_length_371_cov_121.948529_1_plen_49_part_10